MGKGDWGICILVIAQMDYSLIAHVNGLGGGADGVDILMQNNLTARFRRETSHTMNC